MAIILGDSLSWLTAAQDRINSCAAEKFFGFLTRIQWAGALGWAGLLVLASLDKLLGGSTLEACGGVLALVAATLERLHWVSPLEAPLGVAVSADDKEVGVLASGVDQIK